MFYFDEPVANSYNLIRTFSYDLVMPHWLLGLGVDLFFLIAPYQIALCEFKIATL